MSDTEVQILSTARQHFVVHGFAGARMQAIADEAGINKALLHYYFKSKQVLYDRIVDEVMDTVFPRVVQVIESSTDFWSTVDNLVDMYIGLLLKHPEIPVFIMAELSHQRDKFINKLKTRGTSLSAIAVFIARMSEAIEKGEVRPVSPQQFILSFMGMLVFPFMAKPVFQTMMHMEEDGFQQLMLERRTFIMVFLRNALEPDNRVS